ncbi:MAG: MMPL family transporter [Polyangiaceae bacterium]
MTAESTPSPRMRAFVVWATRRRAWILPVVLALAIPAAYRTATLYLHLKTSVEELLPRDAPSVVAIDELRARVPGLQYLGVVVDVGAEENLAAGERLLDDLALRVEAYPPELVRRVRVGDREERAFLMHNAALYIDAADIRAIRERVEARRDYEFAKQADTLLDPDEPPPPLDFSDIQAKYEKERAKLDRFESGRFSSAELQTTLMLIEVGEFQPGKNLAGALMKRVKEDVAALDPASYAPRLRVGYSGDVAISVEETSALAEDLSISTGLVLLGVIGVILAYYRWWRALLILLPPLLLSTFFTFALASLPPFNVTALNSNTAFLGSIIIGNGINFGIIVLARYVEERRNGEPSLEAMKRAAVGSRAGTLAAALAAGASYASLGITEFRGFRQFGCIGGIGMVMSWLLAYLLMPGLASWVDRRPEHAPRPERRSGAIMAPVVRLVERFPRAVAIVAVAATALAIAEVRTFDDRAIEYDLSKLRRADTWVSGEGYWGRKMDALLGTYLTPMAILADDPAQASAIAERLREAAKEPPLADLVASIRTVEDVVPKDQEAKIAETEKLKALFTPRLKKLIPEDKRELVGRFLDADTPTPVGVDDLPAIFTAGLRERDGTSGRTVLVYPKPSKQLWVGQAIVSIVASLRQVAAEALPNQRPARVAGSLELTADIFETLRRDGPRATLLALGGVALVVLLLFRLSSTTFWVMAALVVGVLLLAGIQMLAGIKLNFANFIAYPITFGIGVDYSVNVMSRYKEGGARDIGAAIRSTGGAVALCSWTTVIGYSSLLLAQNRALFLFGLLAVLGEITCLATAIVTMPSVLLSLKGRGRPRGG